MIDENAARQRMLAFIRSPQFEPYAARFFKVKKPDHTLRIILAILFILSIVGFAIGIGLLFGAWLRSRAYRSQLQDLEKIIAASRVITTWVHMANVSLYRERNALAPALVIGSFETDMEDFEAYMDALTERLTDIAMDEPSTEDERLVQEMLADEEHQTMRRRRLPESITGGVPVYLFDLIVFGAFFPGGQLKQATIPCFATPGDQGVILPAPYWVLPQQTASDAPLTVPTTAG